MKYTIYLIAILLSLASCINSSRLGVYKLKTDTEYTQQFKENRKYYTRKSTLKKGTFIRLPEQVDKGENIKITVFPSQGTPTYNASTDTDDGAVLKPGDYKGKIIFNGRDAAYANLTSAWIKGDNGQPLYKKSDKLKYSQVQNIFQAATVPFKFRFPTDSAKYEISTSGNLGIVFGTKLNIYRTRNFYYQAPGGGTHSFLHQKTNTTSWSGGVFVGLTTIELTPDNTGKAVTADRNLLGTNLGVIGVFGFNKFNIGLAGGWDLAFGPNSTKWRYHGKFWGGLVLALDFF